MYLLITVDTEPDDQWNRHKETFTTKNIDYLSHFQKLCEEYGVRPTYLITSTITKSEKCCEILRKIHDTGAAEIGAHLHPWETEPFFRGENTNLFHAFPSEFTEEELRKKLRNLTSEIKLAFGESPTSYRAGRYGICRRQIKILQELEYKVDASITPFLSWKNMQGFPGGVNGPDFTFAPLEPYYPSIDDICKEGNEKILEIPLTMIYTCRFKKIARAILFFTRKIKNAKLKDMTHRILFGKNQPHWFRPLPWLNLSDLLRVVNRANEMTLPYVQMCVHSSELAVGTSSYTKTEEDLKHYYNILEGLFGSIKNKLESLTLSEYSDVAMKNYKNK